MEGEERGRQQGRPLPGSVALLLSRLTERRIATLQAAFYITTGLWPLGHRRSFERVTGPKVEFWLAQTVGITIAAIGAGLAQAGSRTPRVPRELRTVALTSAAGLALVDLYFVTQRRISKIYLSDAAAELALVVAWLLAHDQRGNSNAPAPPLAAQTAGADDRSALREAIETLRP